MTFFLAVLLLATDYSKLFEDWLTRVAEGHWAAREQGMRAMDSAGQVRARQEMARRTFIELLGGFPAEKSPLRAVVTGGFSRAGYRVENVIYESQPGMRVTANLYLPTTGKGPYPAVLGVAGHSVNGKASATYQAAFVGFVRQGFAVLAIDPPGQGERLEYYDPEMRRSRPGVGVNEHMMAGLQAQLTGQTMARYLVWDGIRGVDYLLTRPEIDGKRIAVAGNSGGGTQAAYLAVAEPRLAAVVSSCYMTRWRELWSGPGPQDAEQVLPGFIARGLDFSDFALALAPRPFLMTTAIQDFFPIAGARATYQETQRAFDLLGGGDKAGYFEYDDTHGWSKPRREAASRFLGRWMLGRETSGVEAPFAAEEESALYATATGQLATSAGGSATVQSLSLAEAERLAAGRPALTVAGLEAAVGLRAGAAGPVKELGAGRLEFTVEGGVVIPGTLYEGSAGGRAIVMISTLGQKETEADARELARAGHTVLWLEPRGSVPAGAARGYSRAYQLAARAMLVGRNLVEMQVADVRVALGYLRGRGRLAVWGKGALGPVAVVAGAVEGVEVVTERSIVSYLDVVRARFHDGLQQTVVPGILQRADLPEAMGLVGPGVTLISPVHPAGAAMVRGEAEASLRGAKGRVSVILRGEGWGVGRTLPGW